MKRNLKGQFIKGTGEKLSAETKNRIGLSKKGKKRPPFSEEWKDRLSKARKGNKQALGMKHTEEWKRQNSERMKGNKHNYQGGLTSKNQLQRTSTEYKLWRTAVFERDNYQCIWGGKEHGNKLNVDHIKPFAYFPELRLAIDNGRTLCVDCHRKTDTYAGKTSKMKNTWINL